MHVPMQTGLQKFSTSTASRITTIAAISLLCFLILFMFFLPLIHTYDQAKDKLIASKNAQTHTYGRSGSKVSTI